MLQLQEWKNSELLIVEDMLLNEQDNVTRVSQRKDWIFNLIRDVDGCTRGAEIKVYQRNTNKILKSKGPLKYLVPLKLWMRMHRKWKSEASLLIFPV